MKKYSLKRKRNKKTTSRNEQKIGLFKKTLLFFALLATPYVASAGGGSCTGSYNGYSYNYTNSYHTCYFWCSPYYDNTLTVGFNGNYVTSNWTSGAPDSHLCDFIGSNGSCS